MSGVRNTKTQAAAEQVEETAVKDTKVSDLVEQGFVLEVTARDPDTRDTQNNLVSKGKIFDLYHHPCTKKDCKHDPNTVGQWKKIPSANPERCVN